MTEPVSTRKGIILMLLSVCFFATNCLIIRGVGIFAQVDGWMASFTRGLAGTIFVIAVYSRGGSLKITNLRKPLLIVRGLLGVTAITLLYFTIIHLGVARSLVINLTYPLFGTLIAAIFLRERVRPLGMALFCLAIIGLGLFFSSSFSNSSFSRYDLLALLGAVLAGAIVVSIRKLTSTESAPTIYAAQCVASLVLTLPPAIPSFPTTSSSAWVLLLLGGTVVAYGQILMTRGFHHLSVAQGSALQMLIPILAGFGGFFLFEESLTPVEMAGAAITLFATWRISVSR